jgi:hypothetical protein
VAVDVLGRVALAARLVWCLGVAALQDVVVMMRRVGCFVRAQLPMRNVHDFHCRTFAKNHLSCDAGRVCSHCHSHSRGLRDIPGHIHDPLEDCGSSSLEGWAPGLPPGGGSSSGGCLPPPLPLPLFPPLPLLPELPGKLGGQPHGGPPL